MQIVLSLDLVVRRELTNVAEMASSNVQTAPDASLALEKFLESMRIGCRELVSSHPELLARWDPRYIDRRVSGRHAQCARSARIALSA